MTNVTSSYHLTLYVTLSDDTLHFMLHSTADTSLSYTHYTFSWCRMQRAEDEALYSSNGSGTSYEIVDFEGVQSFDNAAGSPLLSDEVFRDSK